MKSDIDELKEKWKEARRKRVHTSLPVAEVIAAAEGKKRYSLYHQYSNVAILALTSATIVYFFYFQYPLKEAFSQAGIVLMWASPLLRVCFELYSIRKAGMINPADTALKNTDDSLRYFELRRFMNGPVTFVLVASYIVGFYMLTPELLRYVEAVWIIGLDSVFLIGATLMIWQVRKGIKTEMRKLKELVELRASLVA